MLRNTSLILCSTLAILTIACANAPAPPPPDTRAADVQAIKDIEAAWQKDANTKDADKWASYFAEVAPDSTPALPQSRAKRLSKQPWERFLQIPILR